MAGAVASNSSSSPRDRARASTMRRTVTRIFRAAAQVAPDVLRLSSRPLGLALMYHRIAEAPGDPRFELVPAVARVAFEDQLGHLCRHYTLVRASELIPAVLARERGQPIPVAITFDDDLPEHVLYAEPALGAAGVPATFFLCGSSLERPFSHWWESLQLAIDRRLLRPESLPLLPVPQVERALERVPGAIRELAGTVERLPPADRARLESRLGQLTEGREERPRLSAEDVRTLAHGSEIGFHTRRHDALISLPATDVAQRLLEGRDELERVLGRRLWAIAYPHGKADAAVAEAAKQAGFTAGFTGGNEAATTATDPLLVGRLEPRPADSGPGLAAKMSRLLLHGWRLSSPM